MVLAQRAPLSAHENLGLHNLLHEMEKPLSVRCSTQYKIRIDLYGGQYTDE